MMPNNDPDVETIDLAEDDNPQVQAKPVDLPGRIAQFLSWSALAFFLLSLVSMSVVIFILYKGVPIQTTSKNPTEGLAILISSYAGALVGLALAALGAAIGALLLRWAGNTAKRVIPEEDRQLLGGLVTEEKEKGIDLYVRLSSLIGVTGIFTRLGLVGLPLATIGLTLIFTALSFLGKDYMDLTKLTLGAFIGSYVQRQAPPSAGLPSK